MHQPFVRHLLLAGLLGLAACLAATSAAAAEPADDPASKPAPAAASASAPVSPGDAASAALPASAAASAGRAEGLDAIPAQIETTLDSWQEFLDALLLDALGPNPERRYRVFGQRKTVDLGKRWVLALDERPTGLLNSAGVGIPSAGQPARTWEVLHDGRVNDLRFYNHRDGSGRENGASSVTAITPGWELRAQGMKLRDDSVGIVRTDVQAGLRAGSPALWIEGFARRAALEDTQLRENWSDPKPHANFAGLQAHWEALPGLSFEAQHQRAIRPGLSPADERLAGPRTEVGADYRPGGWWSGSRVYWREATDLSLLASSGVEERTTYRRVIGAETTEGSPDGLIYAQVRHRSLVDDRDALLVLGWRHTAELAPQWRAQTLIESGIPVGGDNAVKSTTFDVQVQNNAFPDHLFLTEVQAVRMPIKNTAFASADYTLRLTRNSLFVTRASFTGTRPHDDPAVVSTNEGDLSLGIGWQEPESRLFSTFWRYTLLGRNALPEGVVQPGVADRRAHIAFSEFDWQSTERLNLLLRASRRWDRDESFYGGELRTTNLIVLRPTQRLAERWRLSLHVARLSDSALPAQLGYGAELSVQLNHKIVLALGYNPRGVDDGELSGDDKLTRGPTLRLYIPTEATLTRWLKP